MAVGKFFLLSRIHKNLEFSLEKKNNDIFFFRSFSRLEYLLKICINGSQKENNGKILEYLKNHLRRLLSRLTEFIKDVNWVDGLETLFNRTFLVILNNFYDDFGQLFLKLYRHTWDLKELMKLYRNIKKAVLVRNIDKSRSRGRWLTPILETCLIKKNKKVSFNLFLEFINELELTLNFEQYILYFKVFVNDDDLFQYIFYNLLSNEFLINKTLWMNLEKIFEKKGFQTLEGLLPTKYGFLSKIEDVSLEFFFALEKDLIKLKKKISVGKNKNINFIDFKKELINDKGEVWIDGANVGHFAQKQFKYNLIQVQKMYIHFSKWKKTKIVLSKSRIKKIKKFSLIAPEYLILQEWKDEESLCICPSGIDDDQWLIYGSLSSVRKYPYLLIVTNDLLRDFSFSGKEFLTSNWLQSHLLHFLINNYKYSKNVEKLELKEIFIEKIYLFSKKIEKDIVIEKNWKNVKLTKEKKKKKLDRNRRFNPKSCKMTFYPPNKYFIHIQTLNGCKGFCFPIFKKNERKENNYFKLRKIKFNNPTYVSSLVGKKIVWNIIYVS